MRRGLGRLKPCGMGALLGSSGRDAKGASVRGLLSHAPKMLFLFGVAMFAYLYGLCSREFRLFPSKQVFAAAETGKPLAAIVMGRMRFPYVASNETRTAVLHRREAMAPGLTLLAGNGSKGSMFARLIDADGTVEHAWNLDWDRLWPDIGRHVPPDERPKERPGTHIHGVVLDPDGALTFNYNNLGMVQVDVCGRVRWRLARQTHHAVFRDEAGNFWAPELVTRTTPLPGMPNYRPPFTDYAILKISPDGRVMQRFSMFDLLNRNGYKGLLYLDSQDDHSTVVEGDTLHLNDVEVFPSTMKPDLFQPGDVMVSLRNISSVVVFDPRTRRIRAVVTGRFVRQHDADFLDGSTISVLDNNQLDSRDSAEGSSRIVAVSLKDGSERVMFEGAPAHPFYTDIMGKQQLLPNGDLLLAEATRGRALEVTARGEVVWEYFNQVGRRGALGFLTDAQRIPPSFMSMQRLKELTAKCPHA